MSSLIKVLLWVFLAIGAVPAQAYSPFDLDVINTSSKDIVGFYVTRSLFDGWGENRLNHRVYPGQWWKINLNDGSGKCTFIIKAVFRDGTESEQYNLNICRTTLYMVFN
ncbi:hypothetical protein K2Q08_01580 [Patescibacteria group bacterium]|nr:hypothetical protein [Patescibacteria group bacterium]